MMIISLILLLILCGYCSYTDCKVGLIRNNALLIFTVLGVINNSVFLFANSGFTYVYLLNLVVIVIVSILLYAAHIWAAGDSKLFICVGITICPCFCVYDGGFVWSGVIVPVIAFGLGFIVAFLESIIIFITKKEPLNVPFILKDIKNFLWTYFRNIIYITLVYKIEMIILAEHFEKYKWVIVFLNCAFVVFLSRIKLFINKMAILSALIISIFISFVFHNWFIATRIKMYLLLVAFMLIRIVINSYNYKMIPIEELKKGMILSAFTTLMFSKSKVKNLPKFSTEDLRSRLNEEDIEAIKRWSKTKQGTDYVQIVKKVPFAIYISIATVVHIVIWWSMII